MSIFLILLMEFMMKENLVAINVWKLRGGYFSEKLILSKSYLLTLLPITNKEEVENLIFTLGFKGKQSIEVINKLKYNKAKKYGEQVFEYYKELKETLDNISKNLKINKKP